MEKLPTITLRHYFIEGDKCIGIVFHPNKVIQALIKQLPSVKWSKEHQVVYILNTKENLNAIYNQLRGVAWVNAKYFFKNKPVNLNQTGNGDISWFEKRIVDEGYKECPREYLQKLQLNNLCQKLLVKLTMIIIQ